MSNDDGSGHDRDRGQDRRAFLSRIAKAGASASLAGAAVGAEAQRRLNTRVRRPSMRTRGGADDSVALESVPPIARANDPVPADPPEDTMPDARARAPQPESGGALLDAIGNAPGGEDTLKELGVSNSRAADGTAAFAPSDALTQQMEVGQLAKAYAGGVTLRPEGCEYPEGIELDKEPIRYSTRTCRMSAGNMRTTTLLYDHYSPRGFFLKFWVETPGAASESMCYSVQLSTWTSNDMQNRDPDYAYVARWNGGDTVDWTKTSSGVLMSLVELSGSGHYPHSLTLTGTRVATHPVGRFSFLTLTAI